MQTVQCTPPSLAVKLRTQSLAELQPHPQGPPPALLAGEQAHPAECRDSSSPTPLGASATSAPECWNLQENSTGGYGTRSLLKPHYAQAPPASP